MLIINESGVEGSSVLGSASESYCIWVVIRIAAYRNLISNRINARFGCSNHFLPPHMVATSVALP
jgi:hypothetical protein